MGSLTNIITANIATIIIDIKDAKQIIIIFRDFF